MLPACSAPCPSAVVLVAAAAVSYDGEVRGAGVDLLDFGDAQRDFDSLDVSRTRSIFLLPGMGTICDDFASSQASAICPGVACLRFAISLTRSTMGWLASSASGRPRR